MQKKSRGRSTKPTEARGKGNDSKKKDTTKTNTPKVANKANNIADGIRINRFIANAGVCSRREAESYIQAGIVSINGKIVTELSTKVYYSDAVKFNDKILTAEKKTYIILNKPKDYVTTLEDPHAKKTVIDLIRGKCNERVYPVGRLDKATTGLLMLTNDGDLSEKLAHPRNNKKKIYHATLDKEVTKEHLQMLFDGIELEDGKISADNIAYVSPDNKKEVGIEIHSGKNRIVRRMFEHFGYKVRKLDRVYFAGLTKKNLPRGKWRFLNDKEVNMLMRGAFN